MMQEQKTATLTAIFSDVLANLAFMFSDDDGEATPAAGSIWLETEIAYHGPQRGTLRFWCTRDFSTKLSANLLGGDPEDDDAEAQAVDAVKEFMNIVCGQLITAIHGTESVFDLTIPTLKELVETPRFCEDQDTATSTLFVDSQPLHLAYVPDEAEDTQA
ncbi:MAG: chemotaxis protein CheX [bacterium]|nr:chemotaxis protein CheX [bacterium]